MSSNTNEEILYIMECLGRPLLEGDVRGSHLGKVLSYLQLTKDEILQNTIDKLALVLGMNGRYVKENYLKGLSLFGVIKLYNNHNSLRWKWFGEKAFSNNNVLSKIIPKNDAIPTDLKESVKKIHDNQQKNKVEKIIDNIGKNICKNPKCDKELPEHKIYCSEECLKEYLRCRNGE